MTTVTWTLDEIDDGTRLSLVHEGIAEAVGEGAIGLLLGLDKGWEAHVDTLRSLVNPSMEDECDD